MIDIVKSPYRLPASKLL